MDSQTAVRTMVESCGLTHAQIEARRSRYGGWVGQILSRPRPGADLLAELARACGYRLTLTPIDGGESITIGDDDAPDRDDAPTIDRARATIARGLAMLDALDG